MRLFLPTILLTMLAQSVWGSQLGFIYSDCKAYADSGFNISAMGEERGKGERCKSYVSGVLSVKRAICAVSEDANTRELFGIDENFNDTDAAIKSFLEYATQELQLDILKFEAEALAPQWTSVAFPCKNQSVSQAQTDLEKHEQEILSGIKKIKDSWENVQNDYGNGEFCKVQGVRVSFDDLNISASYLSKIHEMQTVLAVIETDLDFVTYFEANLIFHDGTILQPEKLWFRGGVFDYENWEQEEGISGKVVGGLESAQFLTAFMRNNAAVSLMLAEGIGKMPKSDDFMNVVFGVGNGLSIPFDITKASQEKAWTDCVSSIAARVTERRKKKFGIQ